MGIDLNRGGLFFTYDGMLVGEKTVRDDLAHIDLALCEFCVGMHSPWENVGINLGDAPYVFDVNAWAHGLAVPQWSNGHTPTIARVCA